LSTASPGRHAFLDILFGTFRNPAGYEHSTGFWDGASSRVVDMLLLRDVSKMGRNESHVSR
jgi:hypothetical protein